MAGLNVVDAGTLYMVGHKLSEEQLRARIEKHPTGTLRNAAQNCYTDLIVFQHIDVFLAKVRRISKEVLQAKEWGPRA